MGSGTLTAIPFLSQNVWEKKYSRDPRRADAYVRAKRVRELLEMVTSVEDDSPIPATSHIREFIGGLVYGVH